MQYEVGDLVRHTKLGPDIPPGLVLGATFCGATVTVLWVGDFHPTYVSKRNLEVISARV